LLLRAQKRTKQVDIWRRLPSAQAKQPPVLAGSCIDRPV